MNKLLDQIHKAPLNQRIGGVVGLVVLMTVLNFLTLVQPEQDAMEGNQNSLRALEAQLAEKQAIAQNLNERRREMDVLEQRLAEALTELPERKDIDELLSQLNDIGKKAGLQISKVEPGSETPSGFFSRIPIKMSVAGNYHEIAMFLQEVSNMRRIVNVNNIKLTDAKVRNEKVVLSSEFMATTFRFLDQTANTGDVPKK
ncbi:MAG: type 4a pilus biogenesis protein PilO [Deltaproteobacteria bacterium]|nr:type 4a pilus biogenesis protein PilO [Deltaproteobacteria bacterium]